MVDVLFLGKRFFVKMAVFLGDILMSFLLVKNAIFKVKILFV